jgi:hypothetical protein
MTAMKKTVKLVVVIAVVIAAIAALMTYSGSLDVVGRQYVA